MTPEQGEDECAQCQVTLTAPMHKLWEDEDGRIFCSIHCVEEYEMRQGELQMERKLS